MRHTYPVRVYALVIVVCLLAGAWSLVRLGRASGTAERYRFEVQFQRLAGVKDLLAEVPRAGYISNLEESDSRFVSLYFPAQYVLAPTLLVPLSVAPDAELVLGDFTRREDYAAFGREYGLEIVHEFPMGAVLYRRVSAGKTPPPAGPSPPVTSSAEEGHIP